MPGSPSSHLAHRVREADLTTDIKAELHNKLREGRAVLLAKVEGLS
ncbi:hypothetical protein GCM10009744_60590 [Kribbella alba]|uniref:Uncharacterized protein n=1 Tax=Kribbella alba TaxID=190197 RepID=A0ABN2FU34_9ACTN